MSAAMIATISGTPIDVMMFGDFLALLAGGYSAGVALCGDVGQTSIVGRKFPVEMVDGVAQRNWDTLLNRDVFSSGHG